MKKRLIYISVIFFFLVASGFIILKYKTDPGKKGAELLQIIPRKGNAADGEWQATKNLSNNLIEKIRSNPSDLKSLNALTALYLQEARASGSYTYYNNAALNYINSVLEVDPKNFEALAHKATILLSQHRFGEGLNLAKQIVELYPHTAYGYGILVDANVELGNYREAIEAADRMISIKPDIRSYSRISYLREIHGDLAGAIDAMKLATDAGAPGSENTEWCRVQVGKLYEQLGKIKDAAMHYTIAEANRPGYAHAIAGLARIALAEKDYKKALSLYQQAGALLPDHLFKEGIVEAYSLMGQDQNAKKTTHEILQEMEQAINNGQNEDHEMAHAYMGVNDPDKALEFALREYNRRPANIEVNETVALVYYLKENYSAALTYIETALKTNCKKPELLCHAGLMYAKAGNKTKAKMFLAEALKNDPLLPLSLKTESEEMLALLK
jgi:tetratricopeptide (TPR) repeat protein